jgi:hypothetical protein
VNSFEQLAFQWFAGNDCARFYRGIPIIQTQATLAVFLIRAMAAKAVLRKNGQYINTEANLLICVRHSSA